MTEFTARIVKVIASIPEGKVASYGQVAALAGNPRGARQVSWTLRTQTKKAQLPWQRVINSQGRITIKGDGALIQADMLRGEGVFVDVAGRVDLKVYGWQPEKNFM